MKHITIRMCNVPDDIVIEEMGDGTLMLQKNVGDRWFVSTQDKDGKFYLQENLSNGEIIDMGHQCHLFDAIRAIAGAGLH